MSLSGLCNGHSKIYDVVNRTIEDRSRLRVRETYDNDDCEVSQSQPQAGPDYSKRKTVFVCGPLLAEEGFLRDLGTSD